MTEETDSLLKKAKTFLRELEELGASQSQTEFTKTPIELVRRDVVLDIAKAFIMVAQKHEEQAISAAVKNMVEICNARVEGFVGAQREKFEKERGLLTQKIQEMIDSKKDFLKSFHVSVEEPQYSRLWGQIDILGELKKELLLEKTK